MAPSRQESRQQNNLFLVDDIQYIYFNWLIDTYLMDSSSKEDEMINL